MQGLNNPLTIAKRICQNWVTFLESKDEEGKVLVHKSTDRHSGKMAGSGWIFPSKPSMPYQPNKAQHYPFSQAQYQVKNWGEYDQALQDHHHGQTPQLWGGEKSGSAARGSSPKPLFEQPRGELASAHQTARTSDEAIQITRTGTALFGSTRPHRSSFPAPTASALCCLLSGGTRATIPGLA